MRTPDLAVAVAIRQPHASFVESLEIGAIAGVATLVVLALVIVIVAARFKPKWPELGVLIAMAAQFTWVIGMVAAITAASGYVLGGVIGSILGLALGVAISVISVRRGTPNDLLRVLSRPFAGIILGMVIGLAISSIAAGPPAHQPQPGHAQEVHHVDL